MKRAIAIIVALVAIGGAAFLLYPREGVSQPAGGGGQLTVAIYAPTVPFAGSQARADYMQQLTKAIAAATGMQVTSKIAPSKGALAGADFAILEAQCVASGGGGTVLANAQIGGSTTRKWALFSSLGGDFNGLKGKRVAFVKTGCNDNAFIDNAMLESEATGYFSGRVGALDVSAAVAEVASRKGAEAVFAPIGQQKGLTKVWDAPAIPNPAFVQLNGKLPKDVVSKVTKAVVGFGGGGAISGWSGADPGDYKSLRGRMGTRVKGGVATGPEAVRVDAKDVLDEPKTLDDVDMPPVDQHIEAPPGRLE